MRFKYEWFIFPKVKGSQEKRRAAFIDCLNECGSKGWNIVGWPGKEGVLMVKRVK